MNSDTSLQALKDFTDLLVAKGLSEGEQKEVAVQLNNAIALNLIGRLSDALSDEQKSELAAQKPQSAEELFAFLGTAISDAQSQEALAFSTQAVLKNFLVKIEGR